VKIVACVKEILDPDIASSVFQVDENARKVIPVPGLRSVMSPFDEQAIEVALRIRDLLPTSATAAGRSDARGAY